MIGEVNNEGWEESEIESESEKEEGRRGGSSSSSSYKPADKRWVLHSEEEEGVIAEGGEDGESGGGEGEGEGDMIQ